jgi:hypothetical protein
VLPLAGNVTIAIFRPPVTPVRIEQTGQRADGREINLDLARRCDRIIEVVDGRIQP